MSLLTSELFDRQREIAKAKGFYSEAEAQERKLSFGNLFRLAFGPIVVGEIEFQQPDRSVKTLPLYLMQCPEGHATFDYAHGFPGANERLHCHCGYRHYFNSLSFRRQLQAFWVDRRMAREMRRTQRDKIPLQPT
jgi:hypothetical protein